MITVIDWIWNYRGPKPSPPRSLGLDKQDVDLFLSHWPLWKAVQEKVDENGPLFPVLKFKAAPAVVYCDTKHGLDTTTQIVYNLYNPHQHFTLQQKIPNHTFRQLAINACTATPAVAVTISGLDSRRFAGCAGTTRTAN